MNVLKSTGITLSEQEFEWCENRGKPYKSGLPVLSACKMLAVFMMIRNLDYVIDYGVSYMANSETNSRY